ncbi:hypothetical protein ACUUL3_02575 [Thiovibrio sp. JS02]
MKKIIRFSQGIGLTVFFLWLATSPPAWAVDNAECFGCHGDANLSRSENEGLNHSRMSEQLFIDEGKFNHSVHHVNEIGCVDCHADIEKLDYDAEVPHKKHLEPVACNQCHDEEAGAFKDSVHMKIRGKGITMTCYACHGYHYVSRQESMSVGERVNNACAKCHNPYQSHDWLPQKSEHFAFVECVVCHVPEAPRMIHLTFFDLVSNKLYSGQEILKVLRLEESEFMPSLDENKDGIINVNELENLELMLRQRNVHAVFHAELVAGMHPVVHRVNRGAAERDCENCHAADSPYFKSVALVLPRDDGSSDNFQVDRAVLESFVLRHFYALGGTRMKMLDKIGFLLIAGGVFVVLLHLAVRIATIPLRRKNEDLEKPCVNQELGMQKEVSR